MIFGLKSLFRKTLKLYNSKVKKIIKLRNSKIK